MSKMSRHNSTVLQCFMWFLLLWPGIVDSFPTTDLVLNNRYQRDSSDAEFPQSGGPYELVIQGEAQDVFEFQVCCNKDDGCYGKKFTFCFPSSSPSLAASVYATGAGCNEPQTCAYKIDFDGVTSDNKRSVELFMTSFNTSNCFQGKITSTHMYASNTEADCVKVDGCPLKLDSKERLIINILNAIPDGVTVTATNAHKYVEPTTLPPTTTPPPTEEPEERVETPKNESSAAASTPETGMSDALKFSLIGVGIFVFILIVGGIGFAIYWFCFKKKKSSKPVPPVTVAKTTADATPVTKEAAPIVDYKTFEPKPKTTTENETQDVKRSKHAPSNVPSKHAALSDVVPSAAAAALIPLPPPPMASKDFTASKEPNDLSLFDDESERDGKSQSKKSREQASFSKEVAAAIDKKKMKKKAIK